MTHVNVLAARFIGRVGSEAMRKAWRSGLVAPAVGGTWQLASSCDPTTLYLRDGVRDGCGASAGDTDADSVTCDANAEVP